MESLFTPIVWPVLSGKRLGRTIGFPTLNVAYHDSTLPDGVYKLNVIIQNHVYAGVGTYFYEKQLFEAHVFSAIDELYWQIVTIVPLYKLRDNQSFSSVETLAEQITNDAADAFCMQRTVLTFGTFDHFHPWHHAYLSQARSYGDRLVTIIARDATVLSVKWTSPDHNEVERKNSVLQSRIADLVVLGDPFDYYRCIKTFTPAVICLGYDQHSFDTWIAAYCADHGLTTRIVRLSPFEPDRRKSSLIKQTT